MCFAFPQKHARVEENGGGGRAENHYLPPRIMEVRNGPIAKGSMRLWRYTHSPLP